MQQPTLPTLKMGISDVRTPQPDRDLDADFEKITSYAVLELVCL